jgi:hypothetical protein
LLSTYSRNELVGRQQAEVREHLASCADCRREAASYASICQATQELSAMKVGGDFNTKLLNRVAQERFAETRTRAYLPKNPPLISWRAVVPAVAVAALAIFAAISVFTPTQPGSTGMANIGTDNYRTVQPKDNPNLRAQNFNRNWSVDRVLARLERVNNFTRNLSRGNTFGDVHMASAVSPASMRSDQPLPYGTVYYRLQPVIRVYESSNSARSEEDNRVY